MSLDERISQELAEAVVNQRKLQPFDGSGELRRAGFETSLINGISGKVFAGKQFPPENFRITSVSEENGIKRVIETVVKISGSGQVIYWREM
jgi:hypothetical protein